MSLFGERACLAMPANVEQPRRDDKSATPCEHGSMGCRPAQLPASCLQFMSPRTDALPWVHRHEMGKSGPRRKPCPPLAWCWWEKNSFPYYASNDAGGVRQSSIRLLPPRARDQGATCCNRLASNACCTRVRGIGLSGLVSLLDKTSLCVDNTGRQINCQCPEVLSHSAFPGGRLVGGY